MRRLLPNMPKRVVGTPGEHFEPPVAVQGGGGLAGETAAEGGPARPRAGVRRLLPGVPKCVVGSNAEDFEPSVEVAGNAYGMRQCCCLIGHGLHSPGLNGDAQLKIAIIIRAGRTEREPLHTWRTMNKT